MSDEVKDRKQVPVATSNVHPAGQGLARALCVDTPTDPRMRARETINDAASERRLNMRKVCPSAVAS